MLFYSVAILLLQSAIYSTSWSMTFTEPYPTLHALTTKLHSFCVKYMYSDVIKLTNQVNKT